MTKRVTTPGKIRTRRGIIGVESAIVLIAFVIVAAALAFVVLNMGFSTTQKAKTTITSGLGEASSSMEIAGVVTGQGHVSANRLNVTAIPVKLASGGSSINLEEENVAIRYFSKNITMDNIYNGTLSDKAYGSLAEALNAAVTNGILEKDPSDGNGGPSRTVAIVYWTTNKNNNDILDNGENAVIAIVFADNDRPTSLETINTEVVVPQGAVLSVTRQIPSITTNVVDLG
ncbi:MAG TPA: archaellin/type IV pilin N-terminal domain-containing protein [Nitrososphaera sp.]|nr:archaellin/type IV pilin N-terminal domain-containing protein [Nitrososphaera sp.]